ncbi:PorP/SprF family type IX secretion system membrane protein [Ulvibacterium sp.]|uniref:PorP/SprF family type IX secretion system membrane protein n=1 Tax=Ulvibacterium sp. TaxID=2665914 RepID=UPI0026087B53|nr:PorP/SprF family type IX secretion system membrane protein [Ulvibacterium sp.]
MKKTYISVIPFLFLIMGVFSVSAQQEPLYTLYRYNTNFFNPAAFGLNDRIEFRSNFRNQFSGIEQAPETLGLYLGLPLNERIGIGATLISDKVFIESTTSVFASFAYGVQLDRWTWLHFGVQAGGTSVNIDFNSLDQAMDPVFAQNVDDFNPNVGAGIYLKGMDYYVSLSSPKLLASDRIDDDSGVLTVARSRPQFYLSGGYHFALSDNIVFTPSTLLRFSNEETIADITAAFKILDTLEVGANYRIDRAFGGLLYLTVQEWLEVGYAYETNSGAINTSEEGTHEIGFTLKF